MRKWATVRPTSFSTSGSRSFSRGGVSGKNIVDVAEAGGWDSVGLSSYRATKRIGRPRDAMTFRSCAGIHSTSVSNRRTDRPSVWIGGPGSRDPEEGKVTLNEIVDLSVLRRQAGVRREIRSSDTPHPRSEQSRSEQPETVCLGSAHGGVSHYSEATPCPPPHPFPKPRAIMRTVPTRSAGRAPGCMRRERSVGTASPDLHST